MLAKAGYRTTAVEMKTRLEDRMALFVRNSAMKRLKIRLTAP